MQAVLPTPRPRLKGAHVALCRPDKLLRRAVEAQPPLVEHQQAGAHRLHILDDVGGQEHQPVLGQPGKQVAEVNALLRVQAHRGLVKDQKRRVAQQGLGNAHPLALAAGEGADSGPPLLPQMDGLDHRPNALPAAPQALQRPHVVQKLLHRQLVKQTEVLGQIAQAGFVGPLAFGQRLAVRPYGAAGGQQARHQQLHQGGFARAVGAQQADQAGAVQGGAHPLEGLLAVGIGHVQFLQGNLHGSASFLVWVRPKDTGPPWRREGEFMCFLWRGAEGGR